MLCFAHGQQRYINPSYVDSTVLAHVMSILNARHSYGLDLFLLSVDEGITGYRDDSLEVQRNGAALSVLSVSHHVVYVYSFRLIVVRSEKQRRVLTSLAHRFLS